MTIMWIFSLQLPARQNSVHFVIFSKQGNKIDSEVMNYENHVWELRGEEDHHSYGRNFCSLHNRPSEPSEVNAAFSAVSQSLWV